MSKETTMWNLVDDLADRVYLDHAPHNPTLPYVLITVDGEYDHIIGGASVFDAYVQFDAISRDADEAISIIQSIASRLDGYSDDDVIYSMITEEMTLHRPPENSEEDWLYRKAIRAEIKLHL